MSSPPRPRAPEVDTAFWPIALALAAAGNLANGVWMLASPAHWYHHLPANVPASGPLNEHFVRDLGCVFALLAVALAWGALRPAARLPALLAASGFYAAHAAVHVVDSARGLFPPGHWRVDLVPVYLATALLLGLTAQLARRRARGAPR